MRWDLAGYSSHPIDGNATRVQECAAHLAEVASGIREQISTFDGLGSPETWDTPAAPGFRNVVEDLPTKLDLVATRYEKVAAALDGFHPTLASTRGDAEYWIGRAETAHAEVERAQGGIELMEAHAEQAEQDARTYNEAHPDDPDRQPEPWAGENYHETLSTAQGDLDTAVRRVHDAVDGFNESAGTAAEAIRNASNDDLENEGGLWGAIQRGANWLVENTPIAEITKILDAVAGVLGILALALSWVPIVGQVLAVAALVVGIAALLGHLVLFAAGEETGWELALAVLGVVGGGLGRVAGRIARATTTTVRTTATGARVTQTTLGVGVRGLVTRAVASRLPTRVAIRSGDRGFSQWLPRGTQVHVGPGGAPRLAGTAQPRAGLFRRTDPARWPGNYRGVAVGGSRSQNRLAHRTVQRLQDARARDIRVDQGQQTALGEAVGRPRRTLPSGRTQPVGRHRPDIQATVGQQRVNFQFDPPGGARVPGHITNNLANDPNSIVVIVPQA